MKDNTVTQTSFLQTFYQQRDGLIEISPEQGSRFAKEVAGDFNPIHEPTSRRFCVPGDLLFSLVVHRYGLSAQTHCRFVGMVGAQVPLVFPEEPGAEFQITDTEGKPYLEVAREGTRLTDPYTIDALVRSYVAFSGESFPYVMVPLMEAQGVMVNPARPLAIYERMSLQLHEPIAPLTETVRPRLEHADLRIDGKRGELRMDYALCVDGKPFASGSKHIVLGSLQPYDVEAVAALIATYDGWKQAYRMANLPQGQ